jgi:hypothetical protein
VLVAVLPTPLVNLGQDLDLAPGTTVNLSAGVSNTNQGTTYLWSILGNSSGSILNPGAGSNASLILSSLNQQSSLTVVLRAINPNGCSGSDTILVNIDPALGGNLVSGYVVYANPGNAPVNEGTLVLEGPLGSRKTTNIGSAGNYFFTNVLDSSYIIRPTITKESGGITVADAQLINDYVTNSAPLSGIYRDAADVTGDQMVLANDAQQTAKKAAGLAITNSFDQGTGPGNWFALPDTFQMSGSDLSRNITVLSYGDVNGSFSPILRNGSVLEITSEGLPLAKPEADHSYRLSVKVVNPSEIGSYQMRLQLPEGISVQKVSTSFDNQNLFFHQQGEFLTIVWYKAGPNPLSLHANEELVTIGVVGSPVSTERHLSLQVSGYQEFNDVNANLIGSIRLSIPGLLPTLRSDKILVYPNPNNGTFYIDFPFESMTGIASYIVDLSGKTVKLIDLSSHQNEKYPSALVETHDLPAGSYHIKTILPNKSTSYTKLQIIK